MNRPIRHLAQPLLNRRPDPPLDRQPVHVANVEHSVSADGGLDRSVGAELVDELLSGAVNVEVGGHLW